MLPVFTGAEAKLTNPLEHLNDDEIAALLEEAARRLRAAAASGVDMSLPQPMPPLGKHSRPALGDPRQRPGRTAAWSRKGAIAAFEHRFPEVHETYTDMEIWECDDPEGHVVFAVGCPEQRMTVYGKERGWLSIWNVVNGTPKDLRAVFVDTDDTAETADRAALIYGKGGRQKGLYSKADRGILPAIYSAARVEVHRERCHGPYAKNRLALIASKDKEIEIMLNHALFNHRLRECRSV